MTPVRRFLEETETVQWGSPAADAAVSVVLFCPRKTTPEALEPTLTSVLGQSFDQWELLIVGEGLSQSVGERIRTAIAGNARIRARLHRSTAGLPALRFNEGIIHSSAPHIAFLYPGCVWKPSALDDLLTAAHEDASALCVGRVEIHAQGGSVLSREAPQHFSALVEKDTVELSGVLLPRKIVTQAGLFDPHVFMQAHWQWDMWMRAGRCASFATVDRCVARVDADAPSVVSPPDSLLEDAFRFQSGTDRRAILSCARIPEYDICARDPCGTLPAGMRERLRKFALIPWQLQHRYEEQRAPDECLMTEDNPLLTAFVSGVHNCTYEVTIGNVQEAIGDVPQPWRFGFWPLQSVSGENLDLADQLVLHRTFEPEALALLHTAQEYGKPVAYMADDDMLGLWEQFAEYAFLAPGEPLRAYAENQIAAADAVILYSDGAAAAYRKLNPRLFVHGISIPDQWLDRTFSAPQADAPLRVGFAGSSARSDEMQFLLPVLARISEEFGEKIEFVFWGLGLDGAERLKSPYSFVPYSHSYVEYVTRLRSTHFDLLLAPLFDAPRARRAKTCIKYLEITAAGTIGIYSDVPAYREVPAPEAGLKVANTPEAWTEAIRQMLTMSLEDKRQIWTRAHHDVRRHHTAQAQHDSLLSTLHATYIHGKTRTRRHADGRPRFAYVFHSIVFAGSESFLCRHSEIARAHGFEPVFLAPDRYEHREGGVREYAANQNIPLHFLPFSPYPHPEYPPEAKLQREVETLSKWLLDENIAFVHSANFIPAAGIAAHDLGLPHVASLYQPYRDDLGGFHRLPAPHAGAIDCDSFMYARFWEDQLDVPAFCLRSPVPEPFFEAGAARAARGTPQGPGRRWAVIGAFHHRKGQLEVLKALEQLGEEAGSIELDLIGLSGYFPEYEEECREVIERLHAESDVSVNFMGFSEDLPSLLADIDVMLMASTAESLPQVILEAMAARTLVIATPVAGVPELVLDRLTGVLADGFEAGDVARAMRRCLALSDDEREEIRERAFQMVRYESGWGAVSQRLLWLYREAIRRTAPVVVASDQAGVGALKQADAWVSADCPYAMVEGISYPALRARRYKLHIPRNGLAGLQMRIGMHGHHFDGTLELTITPCATGSPIRKRMARWMPTESFRDPGWAEFRFPSLEDSAGQVCWVEFKQRTETPAPISYFQFEPKGRSLFRRAEKRLMDRCSVPQVRFLFRSHREDA